MARLGFIKQLSSSSVGLRRSNTRYVMIFCCFLLPMLLHVVCQPLLFLTCHPGTMMRPHAKGAHLPQGVVMSAIGKGNAQIGVSPGLQLRRNELGQAGIIRDVSVVSRRGAGPWLLSAVAARFAKLQKAAEGLVAATMFTMPQVAWTGARYASRKQEQQSTLITAAIFVVAFAWAWLNSQKENRSETRRIKAEVKRLARLKKEFEETEANEDLKDDSMAASLEAARQLLDDKTDHEGDEDREDFSEQATDN